MIEAEWWDYEDADELADAVAGDVGFLIEQALEARGRAFVALPGGPLAEDALVALAGRTLEWADVTITPTHDPLVPLTDEESISGQLARLFLPRKARVVPLTAGEAEPKAAGLAADERLAALAWPLDLVLLTVTPDGAVAGIVAGPDMEAALNGPKARRALGVRQADGSDEPPLVTLTRPALASARAVTLLVRGRATRRLVEQALKAGPSSPHAVGRLLAELEMDVDIHYCN